MAGYVHEAAKALPNIQESLEWETTPQDLTSHIIETYDAATPLTAWLNQTKPGHQGVILLPHGTMLAWHETTGWALWDENGNNTPLGVPVDASPGQVAAQAVREQGVAMRRREAELVDRLRRREERMRELEEENRRLRDTAAVARYVADHWREAAISNGWTVTSHPLCLVLAALNGETDPEQLGLDEEDRTALDWARDIAKKDT